MWRPKKYACLKLNFGNVCRLWPFGAFAQFELHFIIFLQGTKSLGLDVGVVHKDFRPVVLLNKPPAFAFIEEFYFTCLHNRKKLN